MLLTSYWPQLSSEPQTKKKKPHGEKGFIGFTSNCNGGEVPNRTRAALQLFQLFVALHMEVTPWIRTNISPTSWLKFLNPFGSLKLEFKDINLCPFRLGIHFQFISFHFS